MARGATVTTVTDMLAAVFNICTQEELNEVVEEPKQSAVPLDREKAERRKVVKNKTPTVRRVKHKCSLLRCVSFATYTPTDGSAGLVLFSASRCVNIYAIYL